MSFDNSIVLAWNGFIQSHAWVEKLVYLTGLYGVYLIPLIWLIWWFLSKKKDDRVILLSSIATGVIAWEGVNKIIKMLFHHDRPLSTLPVKELLFERPENSFPSDHATFLAGIAFFFLFKGKIGPGIVFLLLAIAVGAARIALAVHYPSDILVGFLSGLVVAWIVSSMHDVVTDKVWEPALVRAKKFHLA